MKMTRIAGSIALILLTGCASVQVQQQLPQSGLQVDNDKIYSNGQSYAELRRYFPFDHGNNPGQGSLTSGSPQYRGAAVYFAQLNKLVWVYPAKGLAQDVERGEYSASSKGDFVFNWIIDPKISSDGRSICFSKLSIWGTKDYRYDIATGKTKLSKIHWFR
jgi:hypothetical protein